MQPVALGTRVISTHVSVCGFCGEYQVAFSGVEVFLLRGSRSNNAAQRDSGMKNGYAVSSQEGRGQRTPLPLVCRLTSCHAFLLRVLAIARMTSGVEVGMRRCARLHARGLRATVFDQTVAPLVHFELASFWSGPRTQESLSANSSAFSPLRSL